MGSEHWTYEPAPHAVRYWMTTRMHNDGEWREPIPMTMDHVFADWLSRGVAMRSIDPIPNPQPPPLPEK